MTCCCGQGACAVLVRCAALAGIGVLVGMAHSARVKLVGPIDAPPPVVAPGPESHAPNSTTPGTVTPAPAALGLHITLADAKRLFEEGTPFIDARPDHEYVLGTIPGSFHITPASFSTPATGNLLVFIDQAKPVVIFCTGGDCHDSENLAALLKDAGYTSLHVFTEGFPAWQSAGYEVDIPKPTGGG